MTKPWEQDWSTQAQSTDSRKPWERNWSGVKYSDDQEDVIRQWMLENRYRDGVMGRLEDDYQPQPNEVIYGHDPAADRQVAIYQAEQNDWAAPESMREKSSASIADGAVRGVTLNYNDEMAGVVGGVIDLMSGGSYDEGYRKTRAAAKRQERESKYSNPEAFTGGEVGGAAATIALPALNLGRTAATANTVRTAASTGRPATAVSAVVKDFLKTVGIGTVGGGVWGGLAGFGDGEDLDERMSKAFDYGKTAAMFGGVGAPLLRYVGAPLLIGAKKKFFTSAENKALDAILKRADRSGRSLDDIQADFDRWSKQGEVPETLAELMGPNERELLSALVTSHKATREAAEQTLLSRGRDEVERLNESFARSFGKSGDDFKAAQREARRARVEDPEMYYTAAHFNDDGTLRLLEPKATQGLLAELNKSRIAERSISKASDYADAMGHIGVRDELDDLAKIIKAGEQPKSISVQAADYIERAVNRRFQAANKGQGDASLDIPAGLGSLRNRIRAVIDDAGLGDARSVAAERIQRERLMDEGRNILKPGTDVEDIEAIMRGIPEEDIPSATTAGREAYVAGASRAVSDKLANSPNMVGFADASRQIARTPAIRAKLDAARPKVLTKKGVEHKGRVQTRLNAELDEAIERTADRAQFTNDMIGNSKTAFRQADVESAMHDDALSAHVGDALSDLLVDGPISAVGSVRSRYGRAVGNYMTRPSVYNPKFNETAREVLLAQGDDIPAQIARLRARRSRTGRQPTTPKDLAHAPTTVTPKGKASSEAGFIQLEDPADLLRWLERKLLPAKSDRHYADMLRSGGVPDEVDPTRPIYEQLANPRPVAEELADIAGRADKRAAKKVTGKHGDAQVMTYVRNREPEIATERGKRSSAKDAEAALRKARRERKAAEEAYQNSPGYPGSGKVVNAKNRKEFYDARTALAEANKNYDSARMNASDARHTVKALTNESDHSFQALRQELARRGLDIDSLKRGDNPLVNPAPAGNRREVDEIMAELMLNPEKAMEAARIAKEGGHMNTFDKTGKAAAVAGMTGLGYAAYEGFEHGRENMARKAERKAERAQNSSVEYHNQNSVNYGPSMEQGELAELQAALNYALAKSEDDMISMDGKWGRQTSGMIKRFQRENGLPATGKLTGATIEALQPHVSAFQEAADAARE